MPSQKNQKAVQQLKEMLEKSKAVVLTDYSGLSVKQQNLLRRKIKNAGGQFIVSKNRLFKLALSETKNGDLPHDIEDVLQGTTAFLFAYQDEIAPLKALLEFSKEHELPKTKIGIVFDPEDRILTREEIEALAKLPTHEQLVGQFIAILKSPQLRFVNCLSGNMSKLVLILRSIQHSES